MRIKEQETRLTLRQHDDDDEDDEKLLNIIFFFDFLYKFCAKHFSFQEEMSEI